MSYQYHTLKNGIKVIHRSIPGSVAHCGVMVNTGSRDEAPNESGLAHFMEHMIFKGTKKRKAYHVLSRIENNGGDLNAFTTKEETSVYASFLKAARACLGRPFRLEPSLLGDLLQHSYLMHFSGSKGNLDLPNDG